MSTVFQPWFAEMGWKMQSIFVNGLRAPDAKTSGVKKCVRWMRTQACNDADPNKPNCYMTAPEMDEQLIDLAVDELEYLPCHYVHHFADSMRVLAIHHPRFSTRHFSSKIHNLVAEEIFHFKPETKEEFLERHKDKVEHG